MADKKDVPLGEFPTKSENSYRYDGKYSPQEIGRLKEFMYSEFPHLEYKKPRDGGIIIEYPPQKMASKELWKTAIDTILVPELDLLSPILRRKKTIIRFVSNLYDFENQVGAGGNGLSRKEITGGEYWVRLKVDPSSGKLSLSDCLFNLMHELIEYDFWLKTKKDDKEAWIGANEPIDTFKDVSTKYRNLPDEKIANRRALRTIQRLYPNANFSNPENIYEEDK